MKPWLGKALELLRASLTPPRHELNELDWKTALSVDKKRLTEHLSALGNHPGGGVLVFGVSASGVPHGVGAAESHEIPNLLANLARDALDPPLLLDHAVESFDGVRLLFVHVQESSVMPVHLRGKDIEHAFIRSAGTTRKASRQEVATLMLHSRTPRWEDLRASGLLSETELVDCFDVKPILEMIERPAPGDARGLLAWLGAKKYAVAIKNNLRATRQEGAQVTQ